METRIDEAEGEADIAVARGLIEEYGRSLPFSLDFQNFAEELAGLPAPYAPPGTDALSTSLEPLIADHNAILMANHGVVTYGCDLLTAFHHMEMVEHHARISLVTELLGKQSLLSGGDVEKLLAARPRNDC